MNILTRQASKKSDESVVSHVLSMTDRIMKMTDLVQQNMSQAQEKQKFSMTRELTSENSQLEIKCWFYFQHQTLGQWQDPYKERINSCLETT